ncbi:hypothetical protein RSPO_c01900 [Ralstonia solanacearum Po82]|uniref:Uncharacterized protein n=1 Tax=Ralstonia solanacearum (strain Po82) TaxID=1031711 RepID=F6G1R6_RALS8|nr:hypothetical protein RSPO_c01900 [Ralstonia solanacearum Po82]
MKKAVSSAGRLSGPAPSGKPGILPPAGDADGLPASRATSDSRTGAM